MIISSVSVSPCESLVDFVDHVLVLSSTILASTILFYPLFFRVPLTPSILTVSPFACRFQDVIVLKSWAILHCISITHFLYPFLSWGTSRLFPVFSYCEVKLQCTWSIYLKTQIYHLGHIPEGHSILPRGYVFTFQMVFFFYFKSFKNLFRQLNS